MDEYEIDDLAEEVKDDLIRAVKQQIDSEETLYVKTVYNEMIKKGYKSSDILDKIAKKLQEVIEKMVENDSAFDEEIYQEKLKTLL